MSSERRPDGLPTEPLEWFEQHVGVIAQMTFEYWDRVIREPNAKNEVPLSHEFEPTKRTLPEMPLCGAAIEIFNTIGFPPGFSRASRVLEALTDIQSNDSAGHVFMVKRDESFRRIAFCCFNTQVIDRRNLTRHPGERTQIVRRRAVKAERPELYTVIGEFGVAYGYVEDLQEHLGLRFGNLV